MSTRIGMLLVASAMLLGACGPPPSERPREGAPVVVEGRPVVVEDRPARASVASPASPAPSPSPVVAGSPPPLFAPGQLAPTGMQLIPPSPSPSPSPVPGYVIVATDGAGANLRTGPSIAAPIITTLAEGTPVDILGDPVSAEGRTWRQIRGAGREGWVVSVVVREP